MTGSLDSSQFDLRDCLEQEPYRFEFFQAVRLLRWLAATEPSFATKAPVGKDNLPSQEIVRFHAFQSHQFPASSIVDFHWPEVASPTAHNDNRSEPPAMSVGFMGLTGAQGVLPYHYSETVMERVRHRDRGLQDFLDLFNHRTISLFYRAWCKYRLPILIEESYLGNVPAGEDLASHCLYSLVGIGTQGLRHRLELSDESFVYYAGHFAHYPRNAVSLEAMVADCFGFPTELQQLRGAWLYLSPDDQSQLAGSPLFEQRNNQLGRDVIVGRRIWSVEHHFRLRLGPLSYPEFQRLTPAGDLLPRIAQFVRTYVGPEFDFDVQVALRGPEVPSCQLRADHRAQARLGWNTWLYSRPPQRDVDDATFVSEGFPTHPQGSSAGHVKTA